MATFYPNKNIKDKLFIDMASRFRECVGALIFDDDVTCNAEVCTKDGSHV